MAVVTFDTRGGCYALRREGSACGPPWRIWGVLVDAEITHDHVVSTMLARC